MSMFRKGTRKNKKLRMAINGPSGSGKTYTALTLARGLAGPDGKIVVMDTEHRSAEDYIGIFEFDTITPDSFSVEVYLDVIAAAEREGYDVLVIDSLSHAWAGKDGLLEFVDKEKRKSGGAGNSFTAWQNATPKHNQLIEAMLATRLHLIVTMRTKTEYVLEANERGKMIPKKLGMAPVQRDGLEYEFTVVGDMDLDHNLVISKTRCSLIADEVYAKPDEKLALTLKAWLDEGEAVAVEQHTPTTETKPQAQPYTMSEEHVRLWRNWLRLRDKYNLDKGTLKEALASESFAESAPKVIRQMLSEIIGRHEKPQKPDVPGPDEDLPFGDEPEPEPENLEDF